MVQVMLKSGANAAGLPSMMTTMAEATAGLAGAAFPFFSIFIGVLGAFIYGAAVTLLVAILIYAGYHPGLR